MKNWYSENMFVSGKVVNKKILFVFGFLARNSVQKCIKINCCGAIVHTI